MKQSLLEKTEVFVYNEESIKNAYLLEDGRITRICAAIFLDKNKKVETDEIKKMKELLASYTGIFSNFRGYVRLPIHCMLANSEDPEYILKQSLEAYDILKEYFTFRTYLPIAAVRMAIEKTPGEYRVVAQRTKEIYKKLNKAHRMLTDESDELTCAIMANGAMPVDLAVERTLKAYDVLKDMDFGLFKNKDSVYTIAQIIAASGKDIESCAKKANDIYQRAKEDRHKFDNGFQLSVIGALAILDENVDSIMNDIYEVDAYLSEQKAYKGLFGFAKHTRMTHAAVVVASDRAESLMGSTAAIQATISAIILETIIITTMIVSSSNNSSSSSH